MFVVLSGDKCINGIPTPAWIAGDRHGRPNWRLIRPMFARVGWNRLIRGLRALIDPGFERLDLLGREGRAVLFRRHAQATVAGDSLDQQRFLALAGHNGRSTFATLADE